jgi:hypothetical protein
MSDSLYAGISGSAIEFEAFDLGSDVVIVNEYGRPDHSEGEHRFIVMGMSDRYRLLVVSCTEGPPGLESSVLG